MLQNFRQPLQRNLVSLRPASTVVARVLGVRVGYASLGQVVAQQPVAPVEVVVLGRARRLVSEIVATSLDVVAPSLDARSRARGAHAKPPSPRRDSRPDELDDAERPRSLQESVGRGCEAGPRECQDESWRTRLERVEDEHGRDGDGSERGERVHGGIVRTLRRSPPAADREISRKIVRSGSPRGAAPLLSR